MTYKAPVVLGIQPTPLPKIPSEIEPMLSSLGNNTGNLFFSEALFRIIKNARSAGYGFSDEDLDGRDCIVISAANWLNPYEDFGNLAERLEKTKLPIVLVGIGAQSHDSQQIPVLKGGTLALVKLASSRSSFISVRGDYSQWVLSKYGINNVMATGCPSLLLNGPCIPLIVSPMNFESSSIALHGTRHLFNKSGTLDGYIYRQALQNNIDIILQSELADLYYALNCLGNEVINQKCDDIHRATYEDVREKISKYLQGHGKIFTDIDEWINYLKKSKCFCLGTRFHGTIAALLAGIPATLITHDSRTREMAQKMYIPSVSTEYVDLDSSLVPEKFYDENKIERFKKGFHSYYSEFLRFFSENDIEVSSVFRLIN